MSQLSCCCGAAPIGEVFDTIGFCSDCKDHAEFENDDNEGPQCECGALVNKDGDHCGYCLWILKTLFQGDNIEIKFSKDKAFLTYREPYAHNEETITTKGRVVKHWQAATQAFRVYQFEKVGL